MSTPVAKEDYLSTHPRQALQLLLLFLCLLWQSAVAFLALVLFLLLIRALRLAWLPLLLAGGALASSVMLGELYEHPSLSELLAWFNHGFMLNLAFWKYLLQGDVQQGFYWLYDQTFPYLLGFPLLVVGVLGVMELIPNSAYERELRVLQRAQPTQRRRLPAKRLENTLAQLDDTRYNGTLLGATKTTGQPLVIPDSHVNQLVLVLGTTGGGKTVTLQRFYQRAIRQRYPLVVVDGKPTDANAQWLMQLAAHHDRPFYGFNSGNYMHYDPLAQGGYTELKDKIISLKDEWESDYYRSIAEDYLQTTFEVLLKSGQPFDLKTVVECLDYDTLSLWMRQLKDERLLARVKRLAQYERKDITGLQAHLNLLIHSELGEYFERGDNTFSLPQAIAEQAVVYFALPALRFPSFAKVLGKLVINDLKAVADRLTTATPLFTVFDEFSVFAGEQVLNLVNMGRGKGVHAVLGTQGLADLKRVDTAFAGQVLNCVNTLICHRLNDQDSAEAVAQWAGTQDTFDLTAQISTQQGATGMGSVRRNKTFRVHPDDIKQGLQPGEAFYMTKIGGLQLEQVKIKLS